VYEWDEAKRKLNIEKHGIDFYPLAWYFEWEFAHVVEDRRRDYGEQRFIALAPIGPRLYSMCFATPETGNVRIINLRKANEREFKKYR
jgi:uncharacterized DUF497 family protein